VVVDVGRDPDGRRRQKWHGGFDTRREAEVARAKLVNDLHSGAYITPGRLTLGEWVRESWLPTIASRVKPSTLDSYRRNMDIHVLPAVGALPLQQLTGLKLNALYGDLLTHAGNRGRPLSAKTVRYVHTIVHKALSDAVDAGIVPMNVAEREAAAARSPQPQRELQRGLRAAGAERRCTADPAP